MKDSSFYDRTPVYPNERLTLEHDPDEKTTRILDLVAPLGRGQRCLIVSPPKAGKTTILQRISRALTHNFPDIKQHALLINERPEEITDFERNTEAKMHPSSSDSGPDSHVSTAQNALKLAREQVANNGGDVLMLVDSITRLARAENLVTNGDGKTLSGGLSSDAMQEPRRLFGSARNLETGGSLTIIGTALVETGSQMDQVIFQEFKGTGNMELVLKRRLAEKRLYPALSIAESGTRKEELLFNDNELTIIRELHRELGGRADEEALRFLFEKLDEYETNADLLHGLAQRSLK